MLSRQLQKSSRVLLLVLSFVWLFTPTVRAEILASRETAKSSSIDDLGDSINRSCIAIGQKHYQHTVTDWCGAAQSLDREATLSQDKGKARLERGAAALRALASDAEAGQPIDCYSLRQRFSQVHADLAGHRYALAAQAWARKEFGAARAALASAARSVDRGLVALDEQSSVKVFAALRATEHLAGKNEASAVSAFHSARSAVSDEIEKLRHAIQARQSGWPTQSPFDMGVVSDAATHFLPHGQKEACSAAKWSTPHPPALVQGRPAATKAPPSSQDCRYA